MSVTAAMAAMAAIGGVAALGSAVYGGLSSSKANEKARDLISQQRRDNRAWYNLRMSQDYTQRADVQAAIKRQRELLNEQYNQARGKNIVAGGTDEALALQQQAANQSLSQTMTDVAAQAGSYKDNVEQQYRQQDAALNQQEVQNYQQQAQQAAQAGSQGVNAGLGLMGNALGIGKINKSNA